MQHRRQHDHQADSLERVRIPVLRRDDVGHRIDNGTIVADAAGKDVVDTLPNALDHHSALQDAWLDGGADSAGGVDRVDRAHVMAVAAADRRARLEIDAERRAEQRLLGVVHGEGVAREQHVDEAARGSAR